METIKINCPIDSQQGLGGGFTFRRNLIKSFIYLPDVKYVERIEDADICFVAGPTMVKRETIDKVQALGKKLVVRLDNVPRNSRNRNTGTSRLKEFAERADAVVWQCEWAQSYLKDFIKPKFERIIYNGVDTDIFKPEGEKFFMADNHPAFLYSRFNRDETKNWEVAWYEYQLIQRENKDAHLYLVGNFSPEQIEYNFDFFRGEKLEYLGIIEDPNQMAKVMRGCDYLMATYYNDCYSNTYLEALACGLELYKPSMSGGAPELLDNWKKGGIQFAGLQRMGQDFYNLFKEVLK